MNRVAGVLVGLVPILAVGGVLIAGLILLLGPLALPADIQDRAQVSSALGGLLALLAAIVAITLGIWINTSDFKAEQSVKKDIARLRASLRMIIVKGARLAAGETKHYDFVAELEVVSNFTTSTTGFGFWSHVTRKSQDAGSHREDWRVFFLQVAKLLDTGTAPQGLRPLVSTAVWLEDLLARLSADDIRAIRGHVSNLVHALGTATDDVILKAMLEVFGQSEGPEDEEMTRRKFQFLKAKGVSDPNVDLFTAMFDDDAEALKAALAAGADPSLGDRQVLAAHEAELKDFSPMASE